MTTRAQAARLRAAGWTATYDATFMRNAWTHPDIPGRRYSTAEAQQIQARREGEKETRT